MRLRWTMAGVLALAATACGRIGPPPAPVLLEASQVRSQVYWSTDLDGRRIALDGYIGFDNGANGQGVALGQELTTQPNGKGDQLIRFDLERGDGPNQLQLPIIDRRTIPQMPGAPAILTFDAGKATFKDQAGQVHPLRDRVRVTGKLTYAGLGAGLLSDEDSNAPTGRRFKPRLTDVVLEPPAS